MKYPSTLGRRKPRLGGLPYESSDLGGRPGIVGGKHRSAPLAVAKSRWLRIQCVNNVFALFCSYTYSPATTECWPTSQGPLISNTLKARNAARYSNRASSKIWRFEEQKGLDEEYGAQPPWPVRTRSSVLPHAPWYRRRSPRESQSPSPIQLRGATVELPVGGSFLTGPAFPQAGTG